MSNFLDRLSISRQIDRMSGKCDVFVLGLGVMGAAACHQLAKRGLRVAAAEQFPLYHTNGSSHGYNRIIRKAYFEHPDYVPLLERAYELWDNLARETGKKVYHKTGLVYFAPPDSRLLAGLRDSARRYSIPVEDMPIEQAESNGCFRSPEGAAAVFESDAGWLHVENCVRGFIETSIRPGAKILENERALDWRANGTGIEIRCTSGVWTADKLIIAGGGWSGSLLKNLGLPLRLLEKSIFWYACDEAFAKAPCFLFEADDGVYYGFSKSPDSPFAVKVAEHSGGREIMSPEDAADEPSAADVIKMSGFVTRHLPGVHGDPIRRDTCIYTMTPDENFIVDHHPNHANVVFAAGFSGHGFKFGSVIGEILADLALVGKSALPIGFLGLDRF